MNNMNNSNNVNNLKNLKKFKKVLDSIIEILENDETETSEIIDYTCKSVNIFYEEIKELINKKKENVFDVSKINIYKNENKHIQNLNNFSNNILFY